MSLTRAPLALYLPLPPHRAELGRKYLCFTWHLGPGTLVRPLIRTPSKLQICPECRVRGHVGPQEARLAECVRL